MKVSMTKRTTSKMRGKHKKRLRRSWKLPRETA